MINGKKVLAIIPARGGSKGVKKKNIRLLGGKPLIAWTIEVAKKSIYLDKIMVTTDDEEIMKVSEEWGADVPFKRPASLAQDDTPGIEPILHAIDYFPEYEYIVLLQPTSPLRKVIDIDNAIEICVKNNLNSCVSVTKSGTPPDWIYKIDNNGYLTPLFIENDFPYQRQKASVTYELNGAVYVSKAESLKETKSFLQELTFPYVMPGERSVDIDTIEDFMYCEYLLKDRI
ncbi:N-acylneuraminate cytidylyltransferase [Bacillus oleivorans]|uniref:N-acylneuraminate cytidylyltransferase n=1 Tax=Bacillus oleivorans TaxID=1448271 RepID=A0A285D135_9BACI|nr:acylneuraminate cytidylyltransferase family protein [Bacillus oleivorans]SNX72883.1 N-acylneuraminate cytidylyltransferase [Bacillus oleivorans]